MLVVMLAAQVFNDLSRMHPEALPEYRAFIFSESSTN
jgi:hypothetical protein